MKKIKGMGKLHKLPVWNVKTLNANSETILLLHSFSVQYQTRKRGSSFKTKEILTPSLNSCLNNMQWTFGLYEPKFFHKNTWIDPETFGYRMTNAYWIIIFASDSIRSRGWTNGTTTPGCRTTPTWWDGSTWSRMTSSSSRPKSQTSSWTWTLTWL